MPLVPSRPLSLAEGSALQEHQQRPVSKAVASSQYCVRIVPSALHQTWLFQAPCLLKHLCHFQVTSPSMLLSGAITSLPVTSDENVVDHQKGTLSPPPVTWLLVLTPPTLYSYALAAV